MRKSARQMLWLGGAALAALLLWFGTRGPGPDTVVPAPDRQGGVPAAATGESQPATPSVPADTTGTAGAPATGTDTAAVPPAEPVEPAAATGEQPAAAAAERAPVFDVVRVAPDGQTVVAGQATPGQTVEFLLDGSVIGTEVADASGSFTAILEIPPSTESRELVARVPGADATEGSRMLPVSAAQVDAARAAAEAATKAAAEQTAAQEAARAASNREAAAAAASAAADATASAGSLAESAQRQAETAALAAASGAREAETAQVAAEAAAARVAQATEAERPEAEAAARAAAERAASAAEGAAQLSARAEADRLAAEAAARTGSEKAAAAAAAQAEAERLAAEAAAKGEAARRAAEQAAEAARLAAVSEPATRELASAPVLILPQPDAEQAPVLVSPGAEDVTLLQPAAGDTGSGLLLDRITYTEGGDLVVAGRGRPGSIVRIYANSVFRAETRCDSNGDWTARLTAGDLRSVELLRFDEVDLEGKVLTRLETPFEYSPLGPAHDIRERKIVVQKGDYLWKFAEQYYGRGIRYSVIFGANSHLIRDPDLIYPGQVFTIPELVERQ